MQWYKPLGEGGESVTWRGGDVATYWKTKTWLVACSLRSTSLLMSSAHARSSWYFDSMNARGTRSIIGVSSVEKYFDLIPWTMIQRAQSAGRVRPMNVGSGKTSQTSFDEVTDPPIVPGVGRHGGNTIGRSVKYDPKHLIQ